MEGKRHLIYPSVALASLSTLLFELTQTRILSYIFWNHIVYLTVALALLGFGISGALVAVFSAKRDLFTPRIMARLWCGFGLSMFAAVALTAWVLPLLHALPTPAKLAFCYLVFVFPFVFSGAILTVTFSASRRVGRLYAVDLLCAGLGCVLFFWVLPALGAVFLVLVLMALALLLGHLWAEAGDRDARALARGGFAVVFLMTGVKVALPGFLDFLSEDYKEMGAMMNAGRHPDTTIERTTWTSLARIDVVGNPNAMLLDYPEHPLGSYKIITQDGSAHTRLLSKEALDQMSKEVREGRDPQLFNMVYHLKTEPETAVIGVGGGMDVAYALAYNARSVLGIELNPAIYENSRHIYAEYNGHLLSDPRVILLNQEGRSVLRATEKRFDVIQINAIDTFAALSSGAYVLSENHLYTVEALEDMLGRLKENGVLSVHRWLFVPPRETLRLSALACEAWKRKGVRDVDTRIMVFGKGDWAVSLFKNEPFTQAEVATVAERTKKLGGHVFFWPQVLPADEQRRLEQTYYQAAPERIVEGSRVFAQCIGAYRAGSERQFFDGYVYNVTPTTDDSPFFFEYHRLNAFGVPTGDDEFRNTLRGGSNVALTIYLILGQSTLFILIAVFWPRWRFRARASASRRRLVERLFAAVGLGFMLVEIGIVQKSVLFLGNPMYSLAVVLASLLVSAGLGSSLAAAAGWDARRVNAVAGPLVCALLLALTLGLNPLFYATLHLPLGLRMALVVAVNLPLGLLMGMFFPSGLQAVRRVAPGFVPWAWGINGCASVYGSILAILIAMLHGFNTVLLSGAIVYAVGLLAARLALRQEEAFPQDATAESAPVAAPRPVGSGEEAAYS
ncbi:MAG: hypothetical protein U0793_33060 [Gemmataceae bacterium]